MPRRVLRDIQMGNAGAFLISELENLLWVFDGEKIEMDASIWLYELEKELMVRKYSRRTVKLYLHYNKEFLKFSKKTPYQLYYLAEKRNCSASTINIFRKRFQGFYLPLQILSTG